MGRPGTLRGSAQAELGGTPRDGTLVVHAFVDLTNAAPQRTKTAAVNTAVTFARATASTRICARTRQRMGKGEKSSAERQAKKRRPTWGVWAALDGHAEASLGKEAIVGACRRESLPAQGFQQPDNRRCVFVRMK
jgi:hypothetical protein